MQDLIKTHKQNTDLGTNEATFTVGIGITDADISFVFGEAGHSLKYVDASSSFLLSAGLQVAGHVGIGTAPYSSFDLHLKADATDSDIMLVQSSSSADVLRLNSTYFHLYVPVVFNKPQAGKSVLVKGNSVDNLLYCDVVNNVVVLGGSTRHYDNAKHFYGSGDDAEVYYDGANLQISSDTGIQFSGNIGFNTAPIAKPSVTGSRGGNAALASLLTELANLGLITDSTTA
jgi:hypothetical protein